MTNVMSYQNYLGSVHYSHEDQVFYGKLEGIRDSVSYEGTDVASLNAAFKEAVDDYLDTCRKKKRDPEQPFKGTFNVRVGAALHRRAVLYATEHEKKLNVVVGEALEQYLTNAK